MPARRATTIHFFVTGAIFASFASRIPALQDRLDLSPAQLSLAFLALNGGAVAGLPGGSVLARRAGGRASLRLGFAIYPPALIVTALAPGLLWLCLLLAVMAAANSVIDVAMNVQGVALERRAGRPLLSGLHAAHSFGVLAGGVAGMGAAAAGLRPLAHFGAVALLATPSALAATRALIEDREPRDPQRRARPGRRLALLGLLAFCAFLCEGGASDWSAVHLRSGRGASEALAAGAFVAFSLALACGRLAGDRVVAAVGRSRAVRGAGLLAATGLGLALATDATAPTIAGWAVFGAGISLIAPAVIAAAPALGGTDAPAAIGAVTTIGYLGAFAGPPLIGALAEPVGLSAALGALVAAAATVAFLASRALSPRPVSAR
jgi:predicted MFS family arabinose efflux permease